MKQNTHKRNISLLIGGLVVLCLLLPVARAASQCNSEDCTVVQVLTAPGGNTNYYILALRAKDAFGNQVMDIEAGLHGNSTFETLVRDNPSDDPKQNLTAFSNLYLSPDSKTLYFESAAWAVEDAVHAIDLSTAKVRFVTGGELKCLVLAGQYQGDLVVQQHRYFVQGGSYDALYLVTPSGKDLGMVSEGTDASKVCPML